LKLSKRLLLSGRRFQPAPGVGVKLAPRGRDALLS
jgi:hypothetical protein